MYYKNDEGQNICAVCDKLITRGAIVACTSTRAFRGDPDYPLAYFFHGDCAPSKPESQFEKARFDADRYVSMMRYIRKMGPAKLEWCKD